MPEKLRLTRENDKGAQMSRDAALSEPALKEHRGDNFAAVQKEVLANPDTRRRVMSFLIEAKKQQDSRGARIAMATVHNTLINACLNLEEPHRDVPEIIRAINGTIADYSETDEGRSLVARGAAPEQIIREGESFSAARNGSRHSLHDGSYTQAARAFHVSSGAGGTAQRCHASRLPEPAS